MTPWKRVAGVISPKIATDTVLTGGTVPETKTDSYTIVAADLEKSLRMNAATPKTFTFPSVGASDDGARLTLSKVGAGKLILQMVDSDKIHDSGATRTLYCDVAAETYSTVTVEYCHATVTWNIIGATGTWVTTL